MGLSLPARRRGGGPIETINPSLRRLLSVAPFPPDERNGAGLRLSRLLGALSSDWQITHVGPATTGSDRHWADIDHIDVEMSAGWKRARTNFTDAEASRLQGAFCEEVLRTDPQAVLLFAGAAHLASRPDLPVTAIDQIDCFTLTSWREVLHASGPRDIARALGSLSTELRHERALRRLPATTVVAAPLDAQWLRWLAGHDRVAVVPNGVKIEDVSPRRSATPTIAFTGTLDYGPNIDAAVTFAAREWPTVRAAHPDARFIIAGCRPTEEIRRLHGHDRVEVRADVASVMDVLREAWVAVAPMRMGAGIKNKVLEACATRTPVVLTPIATSGLPDLVDESLVHPRGPALAGRVISLLANEGERERLGSLAFHEARRMSWSVAAALMSSVLTNGPAP